MPYYAIEETVDHYVVRQEVVRFNQQPALFLVVESVYRKALRTSAYEFEHTPFPSGQMEDFYHEHIEGWVDAWIDKASQDEMEAIINEYGGYDQAYEDYYDEYEPTSRIENLTATLAQYAIHHTAVGLPYDELVCKMIEQHRQEWDVVLKNPRAEGEESDEE